MIIQQQIHSLLQDGLHPVHIEVINESHMHSVPPGSESHFKVVLATEAFTGKRAIQRHQQVYGVLKDVMPTIHALALHTYTPEEWRTQGAAPDSPQCHGGSKA